MKCEVERARSAAVAAGLLLLPFTVLAGCSASPSTGTGPPPPPPATVLKGTVMGGQVPVTGASVQLYAAGTTGYGTGSQALFSSALTTDSNGNFTITSADYACPSSGALTYLVATGGNPGLTSDNPAIALMTPLGACGSLSSVPFAVINEVTTVASAWTFASFLSSGARMGTSATNAQGLANAFASVGNLVDITKGYAPGSQAPAGATIPQAKIDSLADILAACVDSAATTACDSQFTQATPPGGTPPADTLDAALDIARNPSNDAAALFALTSQQAPFQPQLSSAPNDCTLAVSFGGGGLDYPTDLAVDSSGNVWAANYCSSSDPCGSVTELSNTGQAISPAGGFTGGSLWESYGLSIDLHGNVWVTNQQTASVNSGDGSVTELSSEGQLMSPAGGYFAGDVFFPVAVTTDTDGNIWTANQGNGTASKLTNSGTSVSGSNGFGAGELAGPSAVAIDANNNAWFTDQEASSGSVTYISADGTQSQEYPSGGYEPSGIAIDAIGVSAGASKGHVWVANYSTDSLDVPGSVSELTLNSNGAVTVVSTGYTSGGIDHPNGIAIDGAGNVWVANYHGNDLTELVGAYSSSQGDPLSPSTGFGADAGLLLPFGIAIDASGNIWVSNYGASTITEFVGAAAPVKTPLVGPPQLP
jgi:streptogramin lyase